MKILHINTSDQGGAAKSCIRLHQGLLQSGVDSHLLMLTQQDPSIPQTQAYQYPFHGISKGLRIRNKLNRILKELSLYQDPFEQQPAYLKNRPAGFETFSFAETPYVITSQSAYEEADIIHLHWVAGFLDYSSFFLPTSKPVIWTLHDMNPFTGGCHYAGNCTKFQIDCTNCPQLQGTLDSNYANTMLQEKIKALADKSNLTIVTPSNWLGNCSQTSQLFGKYVHQVIPYGLDTDVFQPRDKAFARQLLGLPLDKKILLFVADSTINQRKGYHYLVEAFNALSDSQGVALCAIGSNKPSVTMHHSIYELGSVSDERMMSLAYSAADAFVIPSTEDNLPNTVLESFLCGTPAIGFPIGGVQEMIQHGKNGYVCKEISAQSLADTIHLFLQNKPSFDSASIRKEAVNQYALNVQAEAYRKLYKQVLMV